MKENIKEMGSVIADNLIMNGNLYVNKTYEDIGNSIADILYAAGYRKQSETVKEFAEKLTKRLTKEVEDNPEAAASQYKAGLYFAMDLAEQYGKEEK